MSEIFNPAKHPRGKDGKFVNVIGAEISNVASEFDPTSHKAAFKGIKTGPVHLNARASLRSLTVSASKSVPISTSLRLHGAALIRLERTREQRSYLDRLTTKTLLRLSNYLPTNKLQDIAADIILKRQTSFAGVNVGASKPRKRQVSARTTLHKGKEVTSGKIVRSPNRKPRTRSLAQQSTNAKRHTKGRKVR